MRDEEYIYGNTPCYLGSTDVSGDWNKAAGKDVLFYGVPWEGAVTWGDFTGCELAPKVIRLSSARYSGYLPELDHIDVKEHLTMGDAGDIDVVPSNVEETMKRIGAFAGRAWDSGAFPIALGGDHGITYPIVKALADKGKKVGIIHMDAHYDNNDSSMGDPYGRGAPFARLYETDGVRNESLVHLGIHGPRNKPENGRSAKEAGAVTLTLHDIRKNGHDLEAFADKVYAIAAEQTDAVYLSICSDVLDHAFNPGGPIDGNGLHSHELLTLIHAFAKKGLIGMDYVEVYPQQDPNDFSSHFVTNAVLYALAGHQLSRA